MDTLTNKEFMKFITLIKGARKAMHLPELNEYDLSHYCQTLVNSASIAHLFASMQCSDRLDLIEDNPDESKTTAHEQFNADCRAFTRQYLGLELLTGNDPRGAVFKLVVPENIGDSFGDRTHLCVPCNDAYYCY